MIEWLSALARGDDAGRMSLAMMGVAAMCVLGLLALTIAQAFGMGDPDVIMRGIAAGVMGGTMISGFFWVRWMMSER